MGKITGTQGNPEMLLHSINIEVMRRQDVDEIQEKYLSVSRSLEQAGADAIVICANTPHMVYDYVQPRISVPILHIATPIGKEARRNGLKNLALFGNRPTMTKGFIPRFLSREYGISTYIPAEEVIDRSHHFVSKELTQGRFTKEAKNFYQKEFLKAAMEGAEGIILGCTELPLLISQEELEIPLISTTDLHIQMAVDFILQDT